MTPKQARFVQEYLIDLNATQAAIRAGYSAKTANEQGSRLLTNVSVRSAIEKAQQRRADRTEITADRVLQQLWGVANANANELVEFRRCCCRFCWGEDNRYQRTRGEFERDEAAHAKRNEDAVAEGKPVTLFDPQGGIGYDKRIGPNPGCPECFGEGIGYAYMHDTRQVGPQAMLLYAGVKETKDGFEVKMHSPMEARQLVGRHLGLFKDKVEHSGPNGGPVQFQKIERTVVDPANSDA